MPCSVEIKSLLLPNFNLYSYYVNIPTVHDNWSSLGHGFQSQFCRGN